MLALYKKYSSYMLLGAIVISFVCAYISQHYAEYNIIAGIIAFAACISIVVLEFATNAKR